MFLIETLIALISIYLMQDNGTLSNNNIRKALSMALCLLSASIILHEYGVLKGVFVFIGLISLLGTLLTFLLYKIQRSQ